MSTTSLFRPTIWRFQSPAWRASLANRETEFRYSSETTVCGTGAVSEQMQPRIQIDFCFAAIPVFHMRCPVGYSQITRSAGNANQTLAKIRQDRRQGSEGRK
jgi:hypothetical protein